jgi:hypothetical protein
MRQSVSFRNAFCNALRVLCATVLLTALTPGPDALADGPKDSRPRSQTRMLQGTSPSGQAENRLRETETGPRIDYIVLSQTLTSFAEGLSKITGRAVVADGPGDRQGDKAGEKLMRDMRLSGTLPDILSTLNKTQGVLWWTDGNKWTVAQPSSAIIKRLPLGDYAISDARNLIERTFPAYSGGVLEVDAQSRSIVVRGPKSLGDEMDSALKTAKAVPASSIAVIRFGKTGS